MKQKDFELTKQLSSSATSVGANIEEAQQAESRRDFISKLSIAMKEAYETRYWLSIFQEVEYAEDREINPILHENEEVIALLGASIKTAKKRLQS